MKQQNDITFTSDDEFIVALSVGFIQGMVKGGFSADYIGEQLALVCYAIYQIDTKLPDEVEQ